MHSVLRIIYWSNTLPIPQFRNVKQVLNVHLHGHLWANEAFICCWIKFRQLSWVFYRSLMAEQGVERISGENGMCKRTRADPTEIWEVKAGQIHWSWSRVGATGEISLLFTYGGPPWWTLLCMFILWGGSGYRWLNQAASMQKVTDTRFYSHVDVLASGLYSIKRSVLAFDIITCICSAPQNISSYCLQARTSCKIQSVIQPSAWFCDVCIF